MRNENLSIGEPGFWNWRRLLTWNRLRFVVAALILAAMALKVLHKTEILSGSGLLAVPHFFYFAIGFEGCVAAILIAGPLRLSWWATALTFIGFSLVSAYAWISNRSCNCFAGYLPQYVILPLDLGVTILTLLVRPADSASASRSWTPIVAMSIAFGFLAGGMAALLPEASATIRNGEIDYLLADMLKHKRWPIAGELHPDLVELNRGDWMVLVVRRDCHHCEELVEQHFRDPTTKRAGERTAVFVAGDRVWPFGLDHVSMTPQQGQIEWSTNEPFVASPAVFLLHDGTIVSGYDSISDEQMTGLLSSGAGREAAN